MPTTQQEPGTLDLAHDRTRAEEILRRVLSDLSMITDRDLSLDDLDVEAADAPVAATGGVHIAFKLALRQAGVVRRGCLLVPLADAISLACYLMMVTDDGVKAKRGLSTLDQNLKDSLLEVANFVAGATEGALRDALREETEVRTEGCMGLAPGAPPPLGEVNELILCRGRATLQGFPSFELLLELPHFP